MKGAIRLENSKTAYFDEINVKRINIVDEDGTVRMTLTNKKRFPAPLVVDGQEVPRELNPSAGIVFYNDEGYECGALTFSSQKNGANGNQHILLSFDPYLQNDVIDLSMYEENGERSCTFVFSDRPKKSLVDFIKEHKEMVFSEDSPKRREYIKKLYEQGELGYERLILEKSMSGEVSVKLADRKGRERIRMAINEKDVPVLEFLNEEGEVIYSLPPQN
jgi:hypothetical protein